MMNFEPLPSAASKKNKPKNIPMKPQELPNVVNLPSDLLEDDTDEVMELSEEDIIESREAGELQEKDVEEAFEVKGFKGLNVVATLEKKDERKGNDKDPNQDNIIADPKTGLIGVLDGLGGEKNGNAASKAAETVIPAKYAELLAKTEAMGGADIQQALIENQLARIGATDPEAIMQHRKNLTGMVEGIMIKDPAMGKKALALLETISAANEDVKATGGKTTASVGFVHEAPDGSKWAVVANVGDSTAYKRRKNGEMIPLTEEDSLLNALQENGALSEKLLSEMEASPDKPFPIEATREVVKAVGGGEKEYQALKGRSVPFTYKKLRAAMVGSLGAEQARTKLSVRRLEAGDSLLLGTDGLGDKYDDPNTGEADLEALAKDAGAGKTQAERLNNLRKAAKGRTTYKKDDDIALVEAMVA